MISIIFTRTPLLALLFALALTPLSSHAAITVRHFEFGESDLLYPDFTQPVGVGDPVVFTKNILAEQFAPDDPQIRDIQSPIGAEPVYVEGRTGPGSLAVAFDGSTNAAGLATQLFGKSFCAFCPDPDVREVLTTASDGLLQSSTNRGMQLWVKPDPAGLGQEQIVLSDGGGQSGGIGITAQGNWMHIFSVNDTVQFIDTGVPVNFGQWTHVAQITQHRSAGMFVDGVRVDARTLSIFGPGASPVPLTVGARYDLKPFSFTGVVNDPDPDPFIGAVDDLKLMLTSVVTGGFNPRFDLDFFEGNAFSGVEGDINQDGIVDQSDVDIWSQNLGLTLGSGFLPLALSVLDPGLRANPGALLLGDANENGIIDLADFSIIKHAALAQGNLIVPEPGTMALLGFAMLALARRRVARVRERNG